MHCHYHGMLQGLPMAQCLQAARQQQLLLRLRVGCWWQGHGWRLLARSPPMLLRLVHKQGPPAVTPFPVRPELGLPLLRALEGPATARPGPLVVVDTAMELLLLLLLLDREKRQQQWKRQPQMLLLQGLPQTQEVGTKLQRDWLQPWRH
jgi:hypothetical protein